MAVIVQYIVVRDGVQKMTFTTKKEADTYDKMLDIADNLYDFIESSSEIEINEKLLEDISFFLAQNKDKTMSILKGLKPKPAEQTEEPAKKDSLPTEKKQPPAKPKTKQKGKKK